MLSASSSKNPPDYRQLHPEFRWDGKALTKPELLELAEKYTHHEQAHLQSIGQFIVDWFQASPFMEVQTSGSTGKPKKIRVKKQQMMNSAVATGQFFDLPAGTKALLCLPATYIAGKLMIVRALVLGWHLDSVKPQAMPFSVRQKRYDFSAITPYQLSHSLKDMARVKKLIVGGGRISSPLKKKTQKHSTLIYETYAMTETLTHIAARPVNSKEADNSPPPFKTLKGVNIHCDADDCLIIRAPGVSDRPVHTRDIVHIVSNDAFYLIGRRDHIINSGGLKIQPEVVERYFHDFIPFRFFMAGIPDDTLGEKAALFIEAPFSEKIHKTIQTKIADLRSIDSYKKPKEICFINAFSETHSGKIKRKKTVQQWLSNSKP